MYRNQGRTVPKASEVIVTPPMDAPLRPRPARRLAITIVSAVMVQMTTVSDCTAKGGDGLRRQGREGRGSA